MRGKIILILLIMFGLIAARALYSHFATMSAGKRGAFSVPAVTVQEVKSIPVTYSFEAPARVSAKYRVEVTARISGYLTKSYFKEGDYVKAGQLLFEIEPLEYKLAVQQAKGNLDNARAQLNYYEKQLARYEELVSKDYVARSDYDNMLAQRDAYKAQVSLTEGAYRDALRNYSYTQVKAPVDGRIGIINVTVGNYVNAQAGYLTTINSEDPMYVTFPIDSKDYATLSEVDGGANVNRTVEYKFSTGMLYGEKGVQDFRDNKVDETTGTITLRATFKNPHGELIQGDYGRITIFSNNKAPMPIVPVEAVMEMTDGKGVDCVIVAVGATKANEQALQMLKKNDGRILLFAAGYPVPDLPYDSNVIHYRRVEIIGTFGAEASDYNEAAKLLNTRAIDVSKIVEPKRFKLDDCQAAFEAASTPGMYRVCIELN